MTEQRCVRCGRLFDLEADDAEGWEAIDTMGVDIICPECQPLYGIPVGAGEECARFLASLRDLVRSDHLSPEDRLAAVDEGIVLALGGMVDEASDWVDGVVMGTADPLEDT